MGGEHQPHRIVLHRVVLHILSDFVLVNDLGLSRDSVFLLDLFQLADDMLLDLLIAGEGFLQICNLFLQVLDLLDLSQDILSVQMPQFDFSNEFGLDLIDPKALHKVRNHIFFKLGLPDDAYGFVNIQKDLPQTQKQMQFLLFLTQIKGKLPAHTADTEGDPLLENVNDPHCARHLVNEHIEIAGKAVFQGCAFIELVHQLLRIGSPAQIHGQLKARKVDLVPDIHDLLQLSFLDHVGDLFDDGVYGS